MTTEIPSEVHRLRIKVDRREHQFRYGYGSEIRLYVTLLLDDEVIDEDWLTLEEKHP